MGKERIIRQLKGETLANLLQSLSFDQGKRSVYVSCKRGTGEFFLRDNAIVAAKCGRLCGNGALMVMAGWSDLELTEQGYEEAIKKNVTLKTEQIQSLLKQYGVVEQFSDKEDNLFKSAILSIYSLKFKAASAKLTTLLKANKYDYMAWLWYSRLLNKVEHIQAAIDEAHRWGGHDPEILREMSKTQVIELDTKEKVRRCCFCWAPMHVSDTVCSKCKALQQIGPGEISEELDDVEVKRTLHRLYKMFQSNKENSQLAYVLAVGLYNLDQLQKSFQLLQMAVKSFPKVVFYKKSLSFLRDVCIAKGLIEKAPAGSDDDTVIKKRTPTIKISPDQKSILVVEDSKTSRKVIGMVLKREGLQILEATTGEEALELAKNYRPNLVLLDLMLPDMSGYDALPKMRENKHMENIPVIMLTGRHHPEDRAKGLMLGTCDYLTKPFDPKKLISVITKYL